MATLLARKKHILAKVESTYGTDPTPTQAIQTSNLRITPLAGPTVSRNLDRATLGNDLDILVGTYVQLSFEVELAGSGTAGTAPAYNDLLLACGMADTVVASTSVTYAPVSTAFDSATIYFKHDGQEHILTGARGSWSLNADAGTLPKLTFTFMGLYNVPSSQSDGTPDFSAFTVAKPVNNANTTTFSLHGGAVVMEKFSMDLANQVEYRNVVGGESIQLFDRAPAGSTAFEAPAISDKNWFEIARANTLGALSMVHGTVAGNIATLSAPKVQVMSPEYAGDNISTIQASLGFIPDSGDDEVTLAFT